MCFAPQGRALFRHVNFKKCSESITFYHFWLWNVLCATTAYTFSTSQLPKVVWEGVVFTFWLRNALQRRTLFRHLNFQKCSEREVILAFSLANVLRATTACNCSSLIWPDGSAPAALASLLVDPLEPQNIGKTQCVATFLPFRAPGSSFFWLSLLWSSFFFSSLLFSDSSHLCFSSVHIVGSLTSKPPSIKSRLFPSIPVSAIQQCWRSLQDPWKSQQEPNSCHGGSASTLLFQHRGEIENT